MPDQAKVDKLLSLKTQVAEVTKLRTAAESAVNFAKQQQAAVDEKIRAMGIDPDKAEEELKSLVEQLTVVEGQLELAISSERAEYQKILDSTSQLFGGQK